MTASFTLLPMNYIVWLLLVMTRLSHERTLFAVNICDLNYSARVNLKAKSELKAKDLLDSPLDCGGEQTCYCQLQAIHFKDKYIIDRY